MNDYIIYMDASADVDIDVIKEGGIKCVPMEYSLGEEMKTCIGLETTEELKAFYDSQRGGDLTKTTQIAPYNYVEAFSKDMEEGKSILYFSLSSGLSSTYESSCTAKGILEEKYPDARLYCLDTLGATAGIGVLLEHALRNKNNGMSIEDNFNDLETFKKRVYYTFMVPDLMYLKRGGRVGASTALLGTALSIVPMIRIDLNGKLDTFDKKHGNKQAIKELAKIAETTHDPESGESIYIINADAPELEASLTEKVQALFPDTVIKHVGLSPIIGAHTGPGMVAVVTTGRELRTE